MNVYIERPREKGKYEEIDLGRLKNIVERPLADLQNLVNMNKRCLQNPDASNPGWVIRRRMSRHNGAKKPRARTSGPELISVSMHSMPDQAGLVEVKETLDDIQGWIDRQLEILMTIDDGQPTTGLKFVDKVQVTVGQYGYGYIDFARTLMTQKCEDCGHLVPSPNMAQHVGTLKCMQATGDRDLREAGWATAQASHHISAIRAAGVEFDVRPAEFNVWVPPWVAKAIEQFENKEDGYAGLKLSDFLKKVAPDGSK